MRSDHYEELSRVFIARTFDVPIGEVLSLNVPHPMRPDLPEFSHQIDLWWETGDENAVYVHIANAKWRSSRKVDQDDVLLLKGVRQDVAAHKALMITNVGFTSGARAAALDAGIGLHTVAASFDLALLRGLSRDGALERISSLSNEALVFSHEVVVRTGASDYVKPASAAPTACDRIIHVVQNPIVSPSAPISTRLGGSASTTRGGGNSPTGGASGGDGFGTR